MITENRSHRAKTIVVVGNGMVGHRFCKRLSELDTDGKYSVTVFGEEPTHAYNRVNLGQYFQHRNADDLALDSRQWYANNDIALHLNERVASIDRASRSVCTDAGRTVGYDLLVLATGSAPFVPPIPGVDKAGVFCYRTIEDLQSLIAYASDAKSAAVIGGGLLGLEAAHAVHELGLETHVLEFAPHLMPRQLDDTGGELLASKIEELGIHVHCRRATREILGDKRVQGLAFDDGETLDVDLVLVSAGIRPRDEIARACGLEIGPRGGVVVDDELRTSDARIHAVGEVALHNDMIYGLVAPGYEMADALAERLTGGESHFVGADLSAKLKLLGTDVASFGDHAACPEIADAITYDDPIGGVYKKLVFNRDGSRLLGGILVGDASDYVRLLSLTKSDEALPFAPGELLLGTKDEGATTVDMPDEAQVCSCNNVTKGQICHAMRDEELTDLGSVKAATGAAMGCGGCLPLVTEIFAVEMAASGQAVSTDLCEHFAYTRTELYEIAKIKEIKTFEELLASHGKGAGCDACKPTVASILASLWNEHLLDHSTLQDTNDRFLANIQRGGTYSVVPRVPAGEITPQKLIVLGDIAQRYGLYTKITGGQRIDLFGAPAHQLPDIWEELVDEGFESGHAYGKSMRTIKSCVGTNWCRVAVGDAVGMGTRLELRYRGIRSPHKLKAAVSGCTRECAEAQSKDFGLIATEKGWNLYVCGNGGTNPRHADLFATDLDEETCVKYIDRFLMYYIQTADKLTRTARWLENMEGGLDHLRTVIIDDKLGICDELERQMQLLVDSYKCEWKEVVKDPAKRRMFRQFVNTDETEPDIEIVAERDQHRPADWPSAWVASDDLAMPSGGSVEEAEDEVSWEWTEVGRVDDFPKNGGACVKIGASQLAIYHFAARGQWYASQNMCPHRRDFVLSRGILGEQGDVPKIACPHHKKTFSLSSGECLTGEDYSIHTFSVKVEGDTVLVKLPPVEQLDALLADVGRTGETTSCQATAGAAS